MSSGDLVSAVADGQRVASAMSSQLIAHSSPALRELKVNDKAVMQGLSSDDFNATSCEEWISR